MSVQDFSNIYLDNLGYQCPSCNFKFDEVNYQDFCDCGRSYYSGYSPAILLSNANYKIKSKYVDKNYNYLTITVFFIENKTIIKYRYEDNPDNCIKINKILLPEEVLNFNINNLIYFI